MTQFKVIVYVSTDNDKITPKILFKNVGDNGIFKCDSFLNWRTSWKFNGGSLPNNADAPSGEEDKIFIRRITRENEGEYECTGVLNTPTSAKFAAVGYLNVTG